jgi:hypothetical protein
VPPVAAPIAAPKVGLKGTMMGMAMPGNAAPVAPAYMPPAAPREDRRSSAPPHGRAAAPVQQRGALKGTVMGVAVPGVAPIHDKKVVAPSFEEPMAPSMSMYQVPEFQAPAAPPRRGMPRSAIILSAVGVVLAVAAGAVALLWKSPAPMTAAAGIGQDGGDVLVLSCESCPAETKILLGGASATFTEGKATLKLEKRLNVGSNQFKVAVERPGMGRDENIELTVPLDYRVTADLSGLAESPPVLAVKASVAGGSVVIDGNPIKLENGEGRHVIAINDKLKGATSKVERLTLKVPYSVMLPAGKREGNVELDVGIAPLMIEAPGGATVIEEEHFMLAGKTLPGAVVKVAGNPITVDPSGRFAQLYRVDSEGETTIAVEAIAKNHAPRTTEIRIKRVKSLKEEAKAFLAKATNTYSSIRAEAESKKDLPVALMGEVEELRVDHQTTIILLDAKNGCEESPCLARLLSGSKANFAKGDKITVFGFVVGAVAGPGSNQKVPEIRVSFAIAGDAL